MQPNNDHDLLIQLDVKVTEVLRRLDAQENRFSAIESRLSALEGFRWWVIGAAAVAGTAFSYLKDYITRS